MSELIKHECGIALLRLRKKAEYYFDKYGTWTYGLNKMYLMMEKQHNRGQDGAGIAGIKLKSKPGVRYIFSEKSDKPDSITRIFQNIYENIYSVAPELQGKKYNPEFIADEVPFLCDLYLGHLRYGTYGTYGLEHLHPVCRQNNWRSKNLLIAGNFNLTNVPELFNHLVELGQTPPGFSDTVTILESIGYRLDEEHERLYNIYREQGYSKKEVARLIEENLDVAAILRKSGKNWDGGYVMAGLIGHGDAFVVRDPYGIRPAYYYVDDEVAVIASERPVIQTVFNTDPESVKEVPPAHALIIKAGNEVRIEPVAEPVPPRKCSFERIYFSRGTDKSIYCERKKLGELLTMPVLEAVGYDLENTVFSYIPNTAEAAFYGLLKGIEDYLNNLKVQQLLTERDELTEEKLREIISVRPRVEKITVKDIMLRTFITRDKSRDELVEHIYDITYGTVRKGVDNLVVIDDSIVRGTTLRKSIIRILDRLGPKRIVIVSSSPQIRYPDCYGIDMAKLGDFIAFRAAITLLKETGRASMIDDLYKRAKEEIKKPVNEVRNLVKEIYAPFTAEEISERISGLLKEPEINADITVVYQSVEGLHKACPDHMGDWYFTGDYPTPGGNRVAVQSYINFIEGIDRRAY
ncbi:MAG TPA: amidophosphoribosyltransferase [Bacteroidales bacterium]|nr:amidophosphoribosyltransferase [Bacteroidales bacterium]